DACVDSIGPEGKSILWGALAHLTLICMHPQCFKKQVDGVLKVNERASDPTTDDGTPKKSGSISKSPSDITLTRGVAERMNQLMSSIINDITDVQLSWRLKLLFAILDECRTVGDRVLIFSRRMITLDFLQETCR